MKKGYKLLISSLSMMLLFSSFSFAQEVGEILWEDNFNDTATDPGCLLDVGWMYYGPEDGLSGSIVEQVDDKAFLQVGSFGGVLGAVLFQSNGCPEIDTADSDRGHDLLVDSSKGAPNVEITFNINFKKITSSFFSCASRMVQRDTSESYPDSDPTEEGGYQVFISPLDNTIAIARVIGVEEGGSEMSFLDPGSWQYITAPTTDFEVELNVPYWVKFYMYENTFKMKIWEGDLSDEEDEWLLEGADESDSARVTGTFTQFALLSPLDASSTDQIEIDDITVRSTGNTVGVENEITTLPNKYELMANYPNPFNPTTNIQFALPTTSNVKLTVVNALGQVVSELVNGQLSAGVHNVVWNAVNMTSGIYFYRVEANDFVQTRKMLLLK